MTDRFGHALMVDSQHPSRPAAPLHGGPFTAADARHMARALELAASRLGRTWPNPSVGCVVVDAEGERRGEAATAVGGRPHAEPQALTQAGAHARDGTAYVTLEPCSHWGKSPPCADALVDSGLARVVVATTDPDPRVSGRGLARLRAAGVRCEVGLLQHEADQQHRGFFFRIQTGRPWVAARSTSTPPTSDPDLLLLHRDGATLDAALRDVASLPEAASAEPPVPRRLALDARDPAVRKGLPDLLEALGRRGITRIGLSATPADPLCGALAQLDRLDEVDDTPGRLVGARCVLATHNRGKIAEFQALLGAHARLEEATRLGLEAPEETASTYLGNAVLKARAARVALDGPASWVLADDGGLEVEVLDGAPGIHTARFADQAGGWAHARHELARRAGLAVEGRIDPLLPAPPVRARAHCALALLSPTGALVTADVAVDGHLVWPPRDGLPGFAAVFEPTADRPMQKDAVLLHRRLAWQSLARALAEESAASLGITRSG